MKTLPIYMLLIIFLRANPALSFPRSVLVERFTNSYSTFSAQAAETFSQFTDQNAAQISVIEYHTNWPGVEDPWYQLNPAENIIRWEYYNVNSVPTIWMDGSVRVNDQNSIEHLSSAMTTRLMIDSPVNLEVAYHGGSGSPIRVDVIVTTDELPLTNHTLRVVLVEKQRDYEAANGQTVWKYGFLDTAPDPAGIPITMPAHGELLFNQGEFTFPWNAVYNDDNLMIVAFIQNNSGHEIVQSASIDFTAAYAFEIITSHLSRFAAPGEEVHFEFNFRNSGQNHDTYTVQIEDYTPEDWATVYETINGGFHEISTFSLESQQEFIFNIEIQTSQETGSTGTYIVTITSQNRPQLMRRLDFFVMTYCPFLVVNSDPAGNYLNYFEEALDYASGYYPIEYQTWTTADHPIDVEDFLSSSLETVIWYTGDHGTISEENIEYLASFIEEGGNIFACGSDMPLVLHNTEVIDLMGAALYLANPIGTHIAGYASDPISDGMEFEIAGGDGANNRGSPKLLFAVDSSEPCFRFTEYQRAAVRNHTCFQSNTVLFGFPFETISTADNRHLLMTRIIGYLMYYMDIPENHLEPITPDRITVLPVFPNPSNSYANLSFRLEDESIVTLSIFNISGQEVARLLDRRSLRAGYHQVRFSENDFVSGLYFCRLGALIGDKQLWNSQKILLLK